MKIIESHLIIQKIMKNHEMLCENNENYENNKIAYENMKIQKFFMRILKILKILEIHMRIKKNHANRLI